MTTELTSKGDAQAIIDTATRAVGPMNVADGLAVVTVPTDGRLVEIDLNAHHDQYADRPRRKTGIVHVQSAESFVAYITKHGLYATEVWADPARQALTGVINAHGHSEDENDEGLAGHGDHQVRLELIATPSWKAWLARDKEWMDQQRFAEHLEDNILDISDPDAATMLEIAQSFHATTGVVFKSAQRLHSGEATLHYEEQTAARAGQKGDLDIPLEFTLVLQPYAGQDELLTVTARFRYRVRDGHLTLSYALAHADRVVLDVFNRITTSVDEGISQPVFTGRPA